MYEDLLQALMNFGAPKVLIVGDFMLDVYIYGDAVRISPEAPVPVLKVAQTEYRCGGAGSVATDLIALGANAYCVGTIGDDREGETLKTRLVEVGADVTGLVKAANRPTITKQRLVGLAQHLHRQQLIRMDRECTEPLCDELSNAIWQSYRDRLPQMDIVCLQDHDKGLLSPSLCRQMIRLAREMGKKILVDPSLTSEYSKYRCASAITPNRKESSAAVGFEVTDAATAAAAAETLMEELQLDAVIVTLDKQGAYLRTRHISRMMPTRPRNVYDVTGAGDMVLATLAATLAAGYDYEIAVQLANIAGGIEVEKFGTATVSIGEIADEIAGGRRDAGGKVTREESLLSEIERLRRQAKTIVFTNGCFDVLHRGHVEYLQFCRRQGDVVVVGLNSDRSVRTIKGPNRPINSQQDRAAVLAALEAVDYVTIFDAPTPLDLIRQVRPDVLVKGQDWAEKGVVGREFVESYGGKVALAPLVAGRSSTATIEKMHTLELSTY